MNVRPRRLLILSGLLPTLVAAALCLYRPAALARVEWRVYDMLVRASSTRPPDSRVVIVDVDERSLTVIGQWPWRRDLVAALIDELRDLGASVVALDIMFAEADRYDEGPNPDVAFEETLRSGRVILGYALTFDDPGEAPRTCVHHPIGLAIVGGEDEPAADSFFRAKGAICNLPHLAQAAGISGFLNAAPDPDGILRRVPLVVEFDGRMYPALALTAVSAATDSLSVALRIANANASTLMVSRIDEEGTANTLGSGMNVPLDGKSNLLLRYRGEKRTFPYVSAVDVLDARVDPGTFRDKVVFVGTSALGTREVVSTPLDTLFTGVEVHATVADNLLQQDFVRRPEHAVVLEAFAVLIFGTIIAFVAAQFGAGWGAAGGVACLIVVWTGAVAVLSGHGAFLSPLYPTIGLTSVLAFVTGAQAALERVRADRAGYDKAVTQRVMVQALLSLVEIRDAETGRHSRRTQQYARVLARELSTRPEYAEYLTPERIELIATLAPLHDIGKVGVPDRLLNKPGVLTAEELVEMRKHPVHGRDVILKTEQEVGVRDDLTLTIAKDIVYTHHEKWDGSGYPQGLRGADIPIAGRLMALVDVYDAAHSRRVYQGPMQHGDVVAMIVNGRGTHFDPAVVDAFVNVAPVLQRLSEHPEAPHS